MKTRILSPILSVKKVFHDCGGIFNGCGLVSNADQGSCERLRCFAQPTALLLAFGSTYTKPTERQCVEDYIDVAFIFKAGHTADDGCSSAPMRALSSLSAHASPRYDKITAYRLHHGKCAPGGSHARSHGKTPHPCTRLEPLAPRFSLKSHSGHSRDL